MQVTIRFKTMDFWYLRSPVFWGYPGNQKPKGAVLCLFFLCLIHQADYNQDSLELSQR